MHIKLILFYYLLNYWLYGKKTHQIKVVDLEKEHILRSFKLKQRMIDTLNRETESKA